MENLNLTLLKLNRFLFFTPSQSPPPSNNFLFTSIFVNLNEWLMVIPNFFIAIFVHIKEALNAIPNFFTTIFLHIKESLNVIPNFFTTIFVHIKEWFTSIPNFFTTIFVHIKEWFTSIPNMCISLLNKLDQAVPPETRTRILAITAVCVAIILLLVLTFCFFSFIIMCLSVTCSCVWATCMWVGITCQALCCGPVAGVMMKAPGTAGLVISRALFEGAPKAYFVALRAGALVVRAGNTVVGFHGA